MGGARTITRFRQMAMGKYARPAEIDAAERPREVARSVSVAFRPGVSASTTNGTTNSITVQPRGESQATAADGSAAARDRVETNVLPGRDRPLRNERVTSGAHVRHCQRYG